MNIKSWRERPRFTRAREEILTGSDPRIFRDNRILFAKIYQWSNNF